MKMSLLYLRKPFITEGSFVLHSLKKHWLSASLIPFHTRPIKLCWIITWNVITKWQLFLSENWRLREQPFWKRQCVPCFRRWWIGQLLWLCLLTDCFGKWVQLYDYDVHNAYCWNINHSLLNHAKWPSVYKRIFSGFKEFSSNFHRMPMGFFNLFYN